MSTAKAKRMKSKKHELFGVLAHLQKSWKLIECPQGTHQISYYLDPRFKHMPVDSEELFQAMICIGQMWGKDKWAANKNVFYEFRKNKGVFSGDEWLNVPLDADPVMHWNLMSLISHAMALAAFTIDMITIPVSNSAVERTFSAVRVIHAFNRLILMHSTLNKLMYVFCNERFLAIDDRYADTYKLLKFIGLGMNDNIQNDTDSDECETDDSMLNNSGARVRLNVSKKRRIQMAKQKEECEAETEDDSETELDRVQPMPDIFTL